MPVSVHWTSLIRETIDRWTAHDGPRLGAALAFYSLLSLSPGVILIVAVLSKLFSTKAVQQELIFDVALFMNQNAAAAIQSLLQIARQPSHGILATVIGSVTALFGASAVFNELGDALNRMFVDSPRPFGFRRVFRERLFSMLLVAAAALVIALSIGAATALTALHHVIGTIAPLPAVLVDALNFLMSLGASTLLFALIFRYVPDVSLSWHVVFVGAAVAATLFTIGKAILGIYLTWAGVGSAYGAAGSLVAILVWVYYSAQIFYLGAEFTCVYARTCMTRDVATGKKFSLVPGYTPPNS